MPFKKKRLKHIFDELKIPNRTVCNNKLSQISSVTG